jgi:transcription-repair coupling factor (superfamily II helicase)
VLKTDAETGRIPEDYVPDPAVRISLYARLSQLFAVEDIDALREEIEDRFGPLPPTVDALLASRTLSALATSAGVTEMICGPKATAFRFEPGRAQNLSDRLSVSNDHRWSKERLIVDTSADQPHDPAFLESFLETLAAA